MKPNTPDLKTILTRLQAKNERLDREVDWALKRAGLGRTTLELADELAARCSPDRIERANRALEARLSRVDADREWSRVSRPSVEQLGLAPGKHLIRV